MKLDVGSRLPAFAVVEDAGVIPLVHPLREALFETLVVTEMWKRNANDTSVLSWRKLRSRDSHVLSWSQFPVNLSRSFAHEAFASFLCSKDNDLGGFVPAEPYQDAFRGPHEFFGIPVVFPGGGCAIRG